MRMPILALSLFFSACTTSPTGIPGPGSPGGPGPEGLAVHEWGTFTSMVGSTGQVLEGLHHEEEALPSFVHARAPADTGGMKGLEMMPSGVTQKLETPVLYFYGPAQPVSVHVDFPQGIVSQWYPDAAKFQPAIGGFSTVTGGSMDWQAQLKPGLTGFPEVAPTDIWAPSRNVASVPLQIGGENERFIFYRGLGTFAVPFRASANADGTISISNGSPDSIPAVFLLRLGATGGSIAEVGGLAPGQTRGNLVAPGGAGAPIETYVADASSRVAAALVKSGLHDDEARAMVDTWSKSYFRSQGLRVLYIVPRAWTDKLLPITISPKPVELVRTLVGRVELLTQADEQQLLTLVQAAASRGTAPSELITQLGRFAEPKLRRVMTLTNDPNLQSYLGSVIPTAQAQP